MNPDDVKGFLGEGEGEALREWSAQCDGPYMEIGTYCGKSACWIGESARRNGTVLFAVDHHRGNPEMHAPNECHDPDMIGPDGFDSLPWLRSTLIAAELEDVVVPVVARAETLARFWSTDIGFLFIDGGHDAVSVGRDYDCWKDHVTGMLAFHDVTIPDIGDVVERAEADGWVQAAKVGCLVGLTR